MSFRQIEFRICLKSDVTEGVRSPRLTLLYLSVKTNKTPQIKPYLHFPVVSARSPAQLLSDALSHSNKRYVLFATHFPPPLPSKTSNSPVIRSEGTLGESPREKERDSLRVSNWTSHYYLLLFIESHKALLLSRVFFQQR